MAKNEKLCSRKGPVSVFRVLYRDQENGQYRRGKVMRQGSSDGGWCLSPLQAARGRFDEKLWRLLDTLSVPACFGERVIRHRGYKGSILCGRLLPGAHVVRGAYR